MLPAAAVPLGPALNTAVGWRADPAAGCVLVTTPSARYARSSPPTTDRLLHGKANTANASLAEGLSVALPVAVPACAVIRPWGRPEAVVAVPAAGVITAFGAISWDHAMAEAKRLGPVIGFLAAVLVLAQLCDDGPFPCLRRLAGPHRGRVS